MTDQLPKTSTKPSSKTKAQAVGTSPKAKDDPHSIMATVRDPQTSTRINYFLTQKGIPTTHPCLRVEVDTISDQQTLELETEDVQSLFSKFGPIESVTVSPSHKNTAIVVFKDFVSAYFAQQSLHLHHLPTYQARLSVKWNIVDDPRLALPTDPLALGHLGNTMSSQPVSETEYPAEPQVSGTTANNSNLKERNLPPTGTNGSTGKYTCRFEIQIENDKEFQVARRLIGAKGCNMKKILDTCSKGCTGPVQEVIKLRLRGKGSGFKEGPSQQESDEPLHLCISSPYPDKYATACEMAKELLQGVYEEYKAYCDKIGKPKALLHVKMMENVNTPVMHGARPANPYSKHEQSGNGYYPPRGMPAPYYVGPQGRPAGGYYYPPGYPSGPFYKYEPDAYRQSAGYSEAGYHYPTAAPPGFYSEQRIDDKEKVAAGVYYGNSTHQQP